MNAKPKATKSAVLWMSRDKSEVPNRVHELWSERPRASESTSCGKQWFDTNGEGDGSYVGEVADYTMQRLFGSLVRCGQCKRVRITIEVLEDE